MSVGNDLIPPKIEKIDPRLLQKVNPWLGFLVLGKKILLFLALLALIIAISEVDFLTLKRYSLHTFYLLPVCLAFWFGGW